MQNKNKKLFLVFLLIQTIILNARLNKNTLNMQSIKLNQINKLKQNKNNKNSTNSKKLKNLTFWLLALEFLDLILN
jgi:hypothetical protein